MRADDLILFSQVVEQGSFSKVAEENSLTNSVVSKRIARLEEEIGAQLLYRTTRKLTLTEAGKALLHSAKNVKQATQEAMDAVAGFGENVSGHIKMSVPTISGDLILADAVAEFCNQHPGLTVDMSLDNRFVDLVSGGYDLVIRTGYLEDSSLIARHILDSQWVVCASPSYIAKHGKAMVLPMFLAAWCTTIFVMVSWWIFFQSKSAKNWASTRSIRLLASHRTKCVY